MGVKVAVGAVGLRVGRVLCVVAIVVVCLIPIGNYKKIFRTYFGAINALYFS